jgi:hypothetical protein
MAAWRAGLVPVRPGLRAHADHPGRQSATLHISASDPAPGVRHASRLPARAAWISEPYSRADRAARGADTAGTLWQPAGPAGGARSAAGASELARRLFPAGTRKADGAVDCA